MEGRGMAGKSEEIAGARSSETDAASRKIPVSGNRIESRDIFVGTKEVTISHEGEVYRLRLTALNKLILTK